ncbi:T9SS type A sorting domain-containing protein [bacterium]|nr:T9SS type A sorting domain-containing protein [bacterium]
MIDTGQEDVSTQIIQPSLMLLSNYPNPFNPETKIEFTLPTASEINLTIYNLQGKKVTTLKTGYCTAGIHTVDFDGTNLPSGTYFYTLQTKNSTTTRKMLLVK